MGKATAREEPHLLLRGLIERVEQEHTPHRGLINWHGDAAPAVSGVFADGAHRLDGSPWQFRVAGGRVVSAVRGDMRHFLSPDETVHPDAPAPAAGRAGPKK